MSSCELWCQIPVSGLAHVYAVHLTHNHFMVCTHALSHPHRSQFAYFPHAPPSSMSGHINWCLPEPPGVLVGAYHTCERYGPDPPSRMLCVVYLSCLSCLRVFCANVFHRERVARVRPVGSIITLHLGCFLYPGARRLDTERGIDCCPWPRCFCICWQWLSHDVCFT